MSEPTLIQSKTELPMGAIRADRRLRPVSEAGVEAILSSIDELGQIVTPLTVRQRRAGGELTYELLDGAHRLEAARRRGLEVVPVRVFECTNDQAALLEIDGNLAGAELNALDTAVFLATRKAVYERMHPETRADAFKGNRHTGSLAADMMSAASFAATTAEKFGLTDRHVRRMIAAGSKLQPDEIQQLRLAPRPVTLADLQAISAIGEAVERYEVVRMLAVGEARSAAAARKAWLHRAHPPAPVDPVDADYLALKDRWNRARKPAKRRFVDDLRAELADLLGDAGDAWTRMSPDDRRRFVAAQFEDLAVLVTEESARHGDKAVYYNRALPLGDGGADE